MTEQLWSVTTILGEGVPKPALLGWAVKMTAEYAVDNLPVISAYLKSDDREGALKAVKDARWRTSSKALARGSDLHHAAEQLNLGVEPDIADGVRPYLTQYRRFLAEHAPRLLMAEAPVYNRTHIYAGTLDMIAEVDGKTCVLDIKTTDKGPDARSRPPYPEIALQLVAYARAEYVGLDPADMRYSGKRRYYVWNEHTHHEPMPPVDGALALVISPVDYLLVPVRIDDEVWAAWLYVMEVARWQLDISRRVLGPVVQPTAQEVLT